MGLGLRRDMCLEIVGISRNQFYYKPNGGKPGKSATNTTRWRDPQTLQEQLVSNIDVVQKIVEIKLNPDLANWYRMIAMTLKIMGYFINHKKVYRLMQEYLLLEKNRRRTGRTFVKYRRVLPAGPLRVLEMDIKYFWVCQTRRYAYVLTVIDTFTRYALHWAVGHSMVSEQVKAVWEYVIAEYLQPAGRSPSDIDVDVVVRSDNGKQFNSHLMSSFFEENNISHEFTKPYTPEENGHIESFHRILGEALKRDKFATLNDLELRLDKFYESYNNNRSHSGTIGIPPAKFWALHEEKKIDVEQLENRELKFRINIPYQDILTLDNIYKYEYRGNRA